MKVAILVLIPERAKGGGEAGAVSEKWDHERGFL